MAERPRLGELLVVAGVIDAAALDAALEKQSAEGGRIGKLLVEAGVLSEETLVRTLARQLSMPVAWLRDKQVKPEVLARLPGHVALKHRCLPVLIDTRGTETLLIAMEDPSDAAALDEVAAAASCPVRVVLAAPSELDDALARHYPDGDGDDDSEPELLLDEAVGEPAQPAPAPQPAAPGEAESFDLAAAGDAGLDLGSDLDLDAPRSGGGVDLDADDALDLEADTGAGGHLADSLDAAIDDVRSVRAPAERDDARGDPDADTGTDLDGGSDLDAGSDLGAGGDLEIGPDLDAGGASFEAAPGFAASGPSEPSAAREQEGLPRDPELRAIALLLVERGLLSREELTQCLRAAREASGSES